MKCVEAKQIKYFIISLKWEDSAHETILSPPLFIEVSVPIARTWSGRVCGDIDFAYISMIFLLDFRTV